MESKAHFVPLIRPYKVQYINELDCYPIYNYVINETAPKVYFAGFCHHRLVTTSAHTHAYRYLLFEKERKQICEPSLYVEKI